MGHLAQFCGGVVDGIHEGVRLKACSGVAINRENVYRQIVVAIAAF